MPRLLITGAAGILGRAVVPLLEQEEGWELRLTDIVPVDTHHEFVKADLSNWDDVRPLCEGIDEVMHIAAIHPWKPYAPQQYIDCNIRGSYNVLHAAAEAGVRRVIYTSSIAAMGYRAESPDELPFDESKPCRPVEDIYGVTKHVGEQFCEMFRARSGLSYVALRPGTFVPRDEDDSVFGLGLLSTWVHRADVAAAHLLALRSEVEKEAIIITAKAPFAAADAPALLQDAPSVILRHFPEARRLQEQGIQLPRVIDKWYNIQKAETLLGYRPEWDFARWLKQRLAP